jgi:hypothetical protein
VKFPGPLGSFNVHTPFNLEDQSSAVGAIMRDSKGDFGLVY